MVKEVVTPDDDERSALRSNDSDVQGVSEVRDAGGEVYKEGEDGKETFPMQGS